MCRREGYGFKQFGLGQGIEIREFWSRIGYQLPGETGKQCGKFRPKQGLKNLEINVNSI